MSNSIRSSLSPFSETLSDLLSFGTGSSISTKQSRTQIPSNTFSVIQARNPRKRTQNYVVLQRESKWSRTLLIWIYKTEIVLKDELDIRRFWECSICQERFITISITNTEDHLWRKYNIKLNDEILSLLSLSIIN